LNKFLEKLLLSNFAGGFIALEKTLAADVTSLSNLYYLINKFKHFLKIFVEYNFSMYVCNYICNYLMDK